MNATGLESDFIMPRMQRSIAASRNAARETTEDSGAAEGSVLGAVALAEQTISELLRLLEEHMSVRAAFVARQPNDDANSAGPADGACDQGEGTGVGMPIRLADGNIFGMLCFFRAGDQAQLDDRDVRRLQMSARLAARMIDGHYAHGIPA
ncbi:GAF domain-containing protein [Variovorax dokdonensis]|uniref:GAF domain-containing protein n=1 Tax=Variovorax dokdonensis TaxID=344883 RepID=A0ABT7NEU2_9BURK|nr:GAF domain-containing protein [Variovorax dokdonensis]MDM0046468.1 GAF domain-containing protein [Variovorax dokdonensis]